MKNPNQVNLEQEALVENGLTIAIEKPVSNINIASSPGGKLDFKFDIATASFDRVDNDFVITMDDGTQITVEDYFAVGESSLPEFVLQDGATVSGADFLSALSPDMDIAPAAGPEQDQGPKPLPGSGTYAEANAGDFIEGVDRLDMLGRTQWNNEEPVPPLTQVPGPQIASSDNVGAPTAPDALPPVSGGLPPVSGGGLPPVPEDVPPVLGGGAPVLPPQQSPTAENFTRSIIEQGDPQAALQGAASGYSHLDGNLAADGQVAGLNGSSVAYALDKTTGAYGDITSFDPKTGAFTFTLNEASETLAEGETQTETFQYTVADAEGQSITRTITIEIHGTNDGPAFAPASVLTSTVTENDLEGAAAYTVSGTLTGLDVDTTDDLSFGPSTRAGDAFSFSGSTMQAVTADTFGELTFSNTTASGDRGGSWTFEATTAAQKAAINALAEGETVTLNYPIEVSDGHGGVAYETISINITGSNDAPTAMNVANSVTEQLDPNINPGYASTSGNLFSEGHVADADAGARFTYSVAGSASGTYGNITIDSDTGDYTYTLKALSETLSKGQVVTENFSYTVTDEHGGQVTKAIAITVTGTNDVPVFTSFPAVPSVTEDNLWDAAGPHALEVGYFKATDIDALDTLTYSFNDNGSHVTQIDAYVMSGGVATKIGVYTIDPSSGLVKLIPDEGVNKLNSGESPLSHFTVSVHDGTVYVDQAGAVKITGINDAPIYDGKIACTIVEAGVGGSAPSSVVFNASNYIDPEDGNVGGIPSKLVIELGAGKTLSSEDGKLFFHYDPATGKASWDHTPANAYGELKFDKATGDITMTLNDQKGGVAHHLPGDFAQSFKVSVTPTDSNGLEGKPGEVTLTIKGSDDTANYEAVPFTHDNPSLIITPFTGATANSFTGTVHAGDVDDMSKDVRFAIFDGTSYKTGTWQGDTGTFDLKNGTMTLNWDGGAWKYTYTYTGPENANNGLINEKISIRVFDPDKGVYDASGHYDANKAIYDPNDSSTYQEANFTATIVTVAPGDQGPKTALDVMEVKLNNAGGTDYVKFNNEAYDVKKGLNVLDNDMDHTGKDGASWNGVSWIVNDALKLPDSGATYKDYKGEYGTLRVYANGTTNYTVDKGNMDVKAWGEGDTPLRDTFTYPVSEGGKITSGTMVVMVSGINDAPTLGKDVVLTVNSRWTDFTYGKTVTYAHPEDSSGKIINDPDAHDQHRFLFYSDAKGANALTDLGTSVTSSYSLPASVAGFSGYDPDKDGLDGVKVTVTGQHIFAGQYGWLVDNGDGTFKYVVDRANPEVIKMLGTQTKTETFYVKAQETNTSDHLSSGLQKVTVTVTGSVDAPLVHAWGSEANDYNNASAGIWAVNPDGSRYLEFSADHGARDSQTTTMLATNTHRIVLGSVADNAKTLDEGLMFKDLTGTTRLSTQNDVSFSASGKYVYGSNSQETIQLYAAIGENGSIVKVGALMVYSNGNLTFQGESFEKMWALRGETTELFTDAAGTKPLTGIYAFSAAASDATLGGAVTFLPLNNFSIKFGDEAPTLYCRGQKVPDTSSDVDAAGKIQFADVEGESMYISVWDTGLNAYRDITADGTKVMTKYGVMTVNKDGSYTYDAENHASGLDSVKIKVTEVADPHYSGDVVNSTESRLNFEVGGYTPQSKIVLTGEKVGVQDGRTIEKASSMASTDPHLLLNDKTDVNGSVLMDKSGNVNPNVTVLNAGVYVMNGHQITADGHSDRPGVGQSDVDQMARSPVERLEFSFDLLTMTLDNKGTWSMEVNAASCQIYDRVTGATLDYTLANAPAILTWIKTNLGVDDATARSYLQVKLPYQVLDKTTSDVKEADLTLDLTTMLVNSAPTVATISNYNFFGEYAMAPSAALTSTLAAVSDKDLGDILGEKIKYGVNPTVDANGKLVFSATNQHAIAGTDAKPGTVLDYIKEQGGTYNPVTGAVSGNVTLDVPVYSVINGQAVQVGVYTVNINNLGGAVAIGHGPHGEPITVGGGTTFGNGGTLKLLAPDPDNPDDPLWTMVNQMRDAHENSPITIGSANFYGLDEGGLSTGANAQISFGFIGKDILMGDGNGNTLAYGSTAPMISLNTTEAVVSDAAKIMEGSKHTVTSARTEASGWESFTVDGVTKSNLDSDQTWEGRYGYLKWNAATGKFTYEHYQPGDPQHDYAAKLVLGMKTGESVSESFSYSMTDKNGENSGTGKFTVNIAGKDSAFVASNITEHTVEGVPLFSGNLSNSIHNDDLGFVSRYTLTYNGVVYGSSGGTVLINTDRGTLTLNADTGAYTFKDNGTLKHGELADLGMTANMLMGHKDGDHFVVDRTSPNVDFHLKLTGVNDAPEAYDKTEVVTDMHAPHAGALVWSDVDDSTGFTVTGSHNGVPGGVEADGYTIHGEHGELVISSVHETGMVYQYSLHDDPATSVFSDDVHRVVDTFTLDIHDAGSGSAGHEQTAQVNVTFYAVDGDHVEGTGGADILTGMDGHANIIWGGAGNDHIDLTNSTQDILMWKAGDASLLASNNGALPAVDNVVGFVEGKGDDATILDMRDMIKDIKGSGETLDDMFSFKVEGGHTTISISDKDAGGGSHTIQEIVLHNVELHTANGTEGTFAELEQQIKLVTS